eukprot:5714720-Prymnesium_polylepis.1
MSAQHSSSHAAQSHDYSLLALPDDVVERMCAGLMQQLGGPVVVALLSQSCWRFYAHLKPPAFVQRRWQEVADKQSPNMPLQLAPPGAIRTLQQLAFAEALQNLGPNRTVFRGTEILSGSQARLEDFAALLSRHSTVCCLIEGHTWPGMPALMQAELTQTRAGAVAAFLVERGLPYSRLHVRWWSSDVAAQAQWSATEAARVDLFFVVDGLELPARPAYYRFTFSYGAPQ